MALDENPDPARRRTPLPRGPLARLLAGAALIAALFAVLQAADYRLDTPSNDTYQYARQTSRLLGKSAQSATLDATAMYCHDPVNADLTRTAAAAARSAAANAAATPTTPAPSATSATPATTSTPNDSAYTICMAANPDGLSPHSPRYTAIFTSRPGYPVLAAPFAAAFGLRPGLWLTALLCTLAGGALVIALLRAAGCPTAACLAGQALFLAAPTGYWGTRLLTDGPSLTATLLAALGAWWMIRRRTATGAATLLAGLAAGFAIRYSSETTAAAALAATAGFCLWRHPETRHRGTTALLAVSTASLAASLGATALLGWPGFSASLQDTFTAHFERPEVTHPLGRLARLDLRYVHGFPVAEPTSLLMALAVTAVAVALYRRDRVFGALAITLSATGVAALAAHPVASQADRLVAPVWTVLVLGVPVLLTRANRTPPAPPGTARREEPAYAAGTA